MSGRTERPFVPWLQAIDTEFFRAAWLGLFDLVLAAQAQPVNVAEHVQNLGRVLKRFGSSDRPWRFSDIAHDLPPAVFWSTFHDQWSGFDKIPHRKFAQILRRFRPHWRAEYMGEERAAALTAMPEQIGVYRGQCASLPVGLSWTLDRDAAAGFARGHRGILNKRPVIIKATVRRSDVASMQTDREESELVLFSATAARSRQFEPHKT